MIGNDQMKSVKRRRTTRMTNFELYRVALFAMLTAFAIVLLILLGLFRLMTANGTWLDGIWIGVAVTTALVLLFV